jgi:hypothetical protein
MSAGLHTFHPFITHPQLRYHVSFTVPSHYDTAHPRSTTFSFPFSPYSNRPHMTTSLASMHLQQASNYSQGEHIKGPS